MIRVDPRYTYTCITIDGQKHEIQATTARQANSIAEAKFGYANISVAPQESLRAPAKDSSHRGAPARLHRALDAVLDSAKDGVTRENDPHGLTAMQAKVSELKEKCTSTYEAFNTSPTKQNRLRWQAATSALKSLEAAIREEKRYPTSYGKDRVPADCLDCGVLPV
jgi:hypothetical protein